MQISPRVFWSIVLAAALIGFGLVVNPWILTVDSMIQIALVLEGLAGLTWLCYEVVRAYCADRMPIDDGSKGSISADTSSSTARWLHRCWTAFVFVVIAALWLVLYRDRWQQPEIVGDDGSYLQVAAEWRATRQNLFAPYNEHLVVPTRLLTYAIVHASDEATLPFLMALSAIPLFLTAMLLLYLLARRRWRSSAAGLLAVALFSLTTNYREIILWYSATQWLIAFDMLLLALLIVETPDRTLAPSRIAAATLLAFAAPFSYSVGLLVGPLVSVWIAGKSHWPIRWKEWLVIVAPTLGTVASVAVIAPILMAWTSSAEYASAGGRGMLQTADPFGGVVYSIRLCVDLLTLRNLGFTTWLPYRAAYLLVFSLLLAALAALLRYRPRLWRIAPAMAMILLPYALSITFRTWVSYETLTTWTRYQLIPQLGVALIVTAIAVEWSPVSMHGPGGRLTFKQGLSILVLALLLAWLHDGKAN